MLCIGRGPSQFCRRGHQLILLDGSVNFGEKLVVREREF